MKKIEMQCPQCGDPLFPAKSEAAMARTLGLHLRNKHGIVGKHNSRNRKYNSKVNPTEADVIVRREQRLKYQKDYRLKKKRERLAVALGLGIPDPHPVSPVPSAVVEACQLSECPNCRTRFYMIKGQ